MSYEGYIEYLCENGHYHNSDAYDPIPLNSEVHMCAHCKTPYVWLRAVDLTNGSDGTEQWTLEVDELPVHARCNLGHMHEIKPTRYKIPFRLS